MGVALGFSSNRSHSSLAMTEILGVGIASIHSIIRVKASFLSSGESDSLHQLVPALLATRTT